MVYTVISNKKPLRIGGTLVNYTSHSPLTGDGKTQVEMHKSSPQSKAEKQVVQILLNISSASL